MNKIKFVAEKLSGAVVENTIKARQHRDIAEFPKHGQIWGSPAQVKAMILRAGGELTGKRQK